MILENYANPKCVRVSQTSYSPRTLVAKQMVIKLWGNSNGGSVKFSRKKRYNGERFNVISVTRGWVGVQFPEKKHYVTLEQPLWPHDEKT